MTTSFFSRRPRGVDPAGAEVWSGEVPPGSIVLEWEELEEQQRRVLELLREAAGAPVSYTTLRAAGVEFPAGVVCELELAGIPIERCSEGSGQRAVAGVRLAASEAPAMPAQASGGAAPAFAHRDPRSGAATSQPPVARRRPAPASGGRRRLRGRMLALAGLAIALVLVVAALDAIGTTPGRGHAAVSREHAASHVPPATAGAKHAIAPVDRRARPKATARKRPKPARTAPPPPTPAVPVSPALATTLEAQGHDLLESGSYGAAIPVLRRAVASTGESLAACLEPVDENCLTYAYALYDLGRALTLGGDPQAAVPILEQRLEIDNQRPVVAAELSAARAAEVARPAAG